VEAESLRALAATYVHLSPEALTTPNVVTRLLLAYRGFDTLGEVAVLFMVAASLGPLLKPFSPDRCWRRPICSAGSSSVLRLQKTRRTRARRGI